MITTNIHSAKTHLSQLIAKALEGEEVIIAKAGKQLVRLLPIETSTPRTSGQWKGKVSIAADFDTLPGELQAYFNGEE
jgi:prevent-host-death family protein